MIETDNSLQPGMPQMQQQQRAQFRHPLPPDVRPQSPGLMRGMGPNIQVNLGFLHFKDQLLVYSLIVSFPGSWRT